MKRTILCMAGLLITSTIANWAYGQVAGGRRPRATGFARYDANGDGKLSKDELPKHSFHREWFAEYDANGDGTLSQTEYDRATAVYRNALAKIGNAKFQAHVVKPTMEVVATGLSNPCGVAIQPRTGQVFVSDSATGRIVRIVKGKIEEVISGFPIETYGKGPVYKIGPLGLLFLNEQTLVVGGGGRKDGEDELSVFTIPAAGAKSITADKATATFKLPGSADRKGEGNFYGLARIERYLYVTCNGDDTKGWIARATIKNNKITKFERRIATKKVTELDAPVAITSVGVAAQSVLLVGQAGEISVPGDSKVSVYGATGSQRETMNTDLHDITGLAAARVATDRGILRDVTYAIDFAWSKPADAGLYVLEPNRATRSLEKRLLFKLDKPTAMTLTPDNTTAYITTIGKGENGKNGQLIKVILHENRARRQFAGRAAGGRAVGGRAAAGRAVGGRGAAPQRFRGGVPALPRIPNLFQRYDKDNDGNITQKEAGKNWALVKRYDQDGNGVVDLGEYDSATQAPPIRAPAPAPLTGGVAERFIARFDTNKDGVLTEKEMGVRWNSLARIDADKNGKITVKEFDQLFARGPAARTQMEYYDKDRDGFLSKKELGGLWKIFSTGDKDKNDKIDKTEFTSLTSGINGLTVRLFQRFDANLDGLITKAEANRSWRTYGRYDLNGDDKLTAEEYSQRNLVRRDPFAAYDRDKDGKLTKKETGAHWQQLARYDLNKDGALPRDEFDKGVAKLGPLVPGLGAAGGGFAARNRAAGPPNRPAGPRNRDAAAKTTFDRLDVNGDGVLDKADGDRLQNLLQRLDTNADGKVTLEEFKNLGRRPSGETPTKKTAPPKPAGKKQPEKKSAD